MIEPYTTWALINLSIATTLLLLSNEQLDDKYFVFILTFGVFGIISDASYTGEWWYPTSTFGHLFIEDFIYGASFGIISLWIGRTVVNTTYPPIKYQNVASSAIIMLTCWTISVHLTNTYITTYVTVPAFLITFLAVGFGHPKKMLLTGLTVFMVKAPQYYLVSFFHPAWISQYYHGATTFLTLPLFDLPWHFVAGCVSYLIGYLGSNDSRPLNTITQKRVE
jgi:hypothetical protein